MVSKGQKEKKANNSQQMTKTEKDKQWTTNDKNRKKQTMGTAYHSRAPEMTPVS
jgi:hypothetical protein